ncbi:MAG TPA: hypothetical protein VJM83_01900, partial [Nitrospirota bacterium]|nr:hypothetical protein [Nitrospirota bacterium]
MFPSGTFSGVTLLRPLSFLVFSILVILAGPARAAIGVSVSPSSAPANDAGGFTINTAPAAAGGWVFLELIHDLDSDGQVDTNEVPFMSRFIRDDVLEQDFMSGDTNGAPGAIRAVFSLGGGLMPEVKFIVRVTNSLGESATASFTVTAPPLGSYVTVTGFAKFSDDTPVANALVYYAASEQAPLGTTFSGVDGSFIIKAPPGSGPGGLGGFRDGVIQGQGLEGVSAPSGGNELVFLVSDATINGTVTEYGTGNPLRWAGLEAWSNPGDDSSKAMSGADGAYTLNAIAGREWQVRGDPPAGWFFMRPADQQYYNDSAQVTPQVGVPAVADFVAHRERSWLNMKLDASGLAVQGAEFHASLADNTTDKMLRHMQNDADTASDGRAFIGLEPNNWRTSLVTTPSYDGPVMVGGLEKDLMPMVSPYVYNLEEGETRSVTLKAFAAEGAITGRAVYSPDDPYYPGGPAGWAEVAAWCADAREGAQDTSVGYKSASTRADDQGNFRLPVLEGDWHVYAMNPGWKVSDETVVAVTGDGDGVVSPAEEYDAGDLVLSN